MDLNNSVWKLIDDVSKKKGITELVINGPRKIFVEKDGNFIRLDCSVETKDIFSFAAEVSQTLSTTENPIVDSVLPGGERINILYPPYVLKYPAITIRRYLPMTNYEESFRQFGITEKWMPFFQSIISSKQNIIVGGATSVGKTTFLNTILTLLDPTERVITIEDTYELNISVSNHIACKSASLINTNSGLIMRDLVKNALRMRPDRLIVGEVRGVEVFDLFLAMSTGHAGSLSTVHAGSIPLILSRLELLLSLTLADSSVRSIRSLISSSVQFVIFLARKSNGQRIIKSISEIIGMEGDKITFQEIAVFDENLNELVSTGFVPSCIKQLNQGVNLAPDFFDTLSK